MKKDKIIIIVLSIILIICCIGLGLILTFDSNSNEITTKTSTKNLILTCDSNTIKKDKDVTCSLKGKVKEYEVSGISATIEENPDFKLIEVNPDQNWEGDGENGDIDLYTDENKKDEFKITEFKISLTTDNVKEIELNITDNSFFDEEYNEHKLDNITKTLVVEK